GPEALLQVQLRLPFRAAGERAAVAAIQENDLTARAGGFEPFIQPRSGYGRGCLAPVPGVLGGAVEPATVVQNPMAGKVDQQLVVRVAISAELLDPLLDLGGGSVDQRLDAEPADLWVPENTCQLTRVT